MVSKKKLLLINGNQFGYSAGHYYYCKYLRGKFEIEYICFDRGRKKMEMEEVKVWYVSFEQNKIKRSVNFILTCIKQSRKFRPEVLFVVYYNFCFLLSLFCEAKLKVLDIRTGSLANNKLKRKLENTILYIQSLFFTKTIVLSESLREKLGINQRKTLVLSLGAEIYYSGIHDFQHLHLLYVGTLNNRRIYETIEGLGIFLKKHPQNIDKVFYTIVGFGTSKDEQKLNKVIKQNGLEWLVSFKGRRNYNELPPFFENANVGVAYIPIQDRYQRQPATKVYEYALSGMFTIATDTFENRKIIDYTNGILCIDNPQSFVDALEFCFESRLTFNSETIRDTLKEYEWVKLVSNNLLPFLS